MPTLLRTDKDSLTKEEILEYVKTNERGRVPEFNTLWQYYLGKNETILAKKSPDANNPDNKTPVAYGRKIVTTFVGYAYRPGYITYKSENAEYIVQLKETFKFNKEHIKTSRGGRNTAIFGEAYEILYVDRQDEASLVAKAQPRFFQVDPREMILLYDYSPEPKKKIAIRYYVVGKTLRKAEVYYPDRIETYDMIRDESSIDGGGWKISATGSSQNFFGAVPVAAYYFGEERLGIIEPVLDLIDDYDLLVSDGINEFERFANAYLLLVKFALSDPMKKKEAGAESGPLRLLKRRRVFQNLPSPDAVKFLTKDIPTGFIEYMSDLIRRQIHVQSHVPDFTDKSFASDISGVAVQRLLFDFENVVASAEADFDVGLFERQALINSLYEKNKMLVDEVTISHKRNLPSDLQEFASLARTMKETGFSSYLVADVMPDNVIPDVDAELERQKDERNNEVDEFGME